MMGRKPYLTVAGMLLGWMVTGCQQTGPQNPFLRNNPSANPTGAHGWQQNSTGQQFPGSSQGSAQMPNGNPMQGNFNQPGMPQGSLGMPSNNSPLPQGSIQQNSNFQSRLTTPNQPFAPAPVAPNGQTLKPGTLMPTGNSSTSGQSPNGVNNFGQPIQPPLNTIHPTSYNGQPAQFPQNVQGYPNMQSGSNQLPTQVPGSRVQVRTLPGSDLGQPGVQPPNGSISNSRYTSQTSPYAYPGANQTNPSLPYSNQQ